MLRNQATMNKKDLKASLLSYLYAHCFGKHNATTSSKLAEGVGYKPSGTNLPIRKVLKEALKEGHPVVSNGKGFYVTVETNDLRDYQRNLLGRVEGIITDIRAVENIIRRM